jgi:hypothetical protein
VELEERRLKSEEERDARRKELDEKTLEMHRRRIKVEEGRDARLERQESRQSQMEELRIAGQKAQTELMTKMLEMFQQRRLIIAFIGQVFERLIENGKILR